MRNEKMYDGITEIREDIIERAQSHKFKNLSYMYKTKWIAVAASVCLVVGLGVNAMLSSWKGGCSEGGLASGIPFMNYDGPVFPLTASTDTSGISVERNIDFDFASYENDGNEINLQDRYILTNTTGKDIEVSAVYPFIGSFCDKISRFPEVNVNGVQVKTDLYAGGYSGGYGSSDPYNSAATDRINLENLTNWQEYESLLSDGQYMNRAFAKKYPRLDEKVIVYKISNIEYAGSGENASAALNLEYDMDFEKTTIMTYGSAGGSDYEEINAGSRVFWANGVNASGEDKDGYVIVIGNDITNLKMQGYSNAGCNEDDKIDSVTAELYKYETTLREILWQIVIEKKNYGVEENISKMILDEIFFGEISRLLCEYGILAENVAERYNFGRVEEIVEDVCVMPRVMYMTFGVIVPADSVVEINVSMLKEASYDYHGEHEKRHGYDMLTKLGTVLDFSKQTASISNTNNIKIMGQNFGFDLKKGIIQVELDINEPHYYIEVYKK